jgi:ubiquinone/menaquinone biosynthesis C-methylase UbiE
MNHELTDRQQRELEYHREHAKLHQSLLSSPFSWDVLQHPNRRWWNAYWAMYECLVNCGLKDKAVLVVGCGFGDDALRVAKLGARVSAFDLSPDSLQIAKALASREGLQIDFGEMPAEKMSYEDNSFDYVLARDILHHVDIPKAMHEIVRVAKPNALFVVNEIYSHSLTGVIRHSSLVENFLYPRMRKLIYGAGIPYITEDEKKLSEYDLKEIMLPLQPRLVTKYFNFLVTRVIPDRFEAAAKLDRMLLRILHPIAPLIAGRVLFSARISKSDNSGSTTPVNFGA